MHVALTKSSKASSAKWGPVLSPQSHAEHKERERGYIKVGANMWAWEHLRDGVHLIPSLPGIIHSELRPCWGWEVTGPLSGGGFQELVAPLMAFIAGGGR